MRGELKKLQDELNQTIIYVTAGFIDTPTPSSTARLQRKRTGPISMLDCFQIGTTNESQLNQRHILCFLVSVGLTLSELRKKLGRGRHTLRG